MHRATQEIYEALRQEDGLKVFTEENGKQSNVWLQFGLDGGGNYKIKFISTDEDYDVAVRVFSLIHAGEAQRAKVIDALNDLNCKFRYAKFCCDSDGDVNVEYDFPQHGSNPAASAREIMIRLYQIVKEAYPVLMRAMWS